jgi:hypothetical protein
MAGSEEEKERTRASLSIDKKVEIIHLVETGLKQVDVAWLTRALYAIVSCT